jgi:hypothetical protein
MPIPETSNFDGIIVTPRVSQMCNIKEKDKESPESLRRNGADETFY